MAERTTAAVGLSIGDVARRAELHTSALRYYESVGLLKPPRRVSKRRVYDDEVLDVLRLIRLAKGAGFTVAEIRRLLHGFDRETPASARWQAMAARKLRDVTELIDRARSMQQVLEALLTCTCVDLADCVRPGASAQRAAREETGRE